MPPAIPAIVAAVPALIASNVALAAFAFVSTLALGFIQKALAPKPKRTDPQQQDRFISLREPTGTRKIAFGITRLGGTQTFVHSNGETKQYLRTVISITGHPATEFLALYLDNELVPLDSNGAATGKYAGYVWAWFGLGTEAGDTAFQAALAAGASEVWTADHEQTGVAKLHVVYAFNPDLFTGAIPNPTVICRWMGGIWDPRTDTSGFTDNPALCIAHYLMMSEADGGVGAELSEIDEDALVAAANICDEMVERRNVTVDFTAADTDIITVADASARLRLGTRIQVASSGTLPPGLAAATSYFWIPVSSLGGKVATSLANARAGTAVNITGAGSGTHSLEVEAEPRYTLNASFDTAETPRDILLKMLSSMAGGISFAGGKFRILAGAWREPETSFDLSHLAGPIAVNHLRSRRDLYNGIKGVFFNPDDLYQPTDYPAVQDATALAADGDRETWLDREFPCTNSPSMCQRLAKILLERNRRQAQVAWPVNLAGLQVQALDTVSITADIRGWDEKTFEVDSLRLAPGEGEGGPVLTVEMQLSEHDEDVFAWDADTDERLLGESVTTTLPDPTDVEPPTGVLVWGETVSGVPRLRSTWTAAADGFVVDYEVQVKKSSESGYTTGIRTGGSTEFTYSPILTGTDYDLRVRSVNHRGATSEWVEVTGIDDAGDNIPPSAPTVIDAAPIDTGPITQISITAQAPASSDTRFLRVYREEGSPDLLVGEVACLPGEQKMFTDSDGPFNAVSLPFYFATALDAQGNESAASAAVQAEIDLGGGGP